MLLCRWVHVWRAYGADFIAVAAGSDHSLGLKSNGSIVGWGSNYHGQLNTPAPNAGFVAIGAREDYSAGLKSDGTIVVWGANYGGRVDVPQPNQGYTSLSCGGHILAIRGQPACYANCDRSTEPPILNVDDFTCFISEYAQGTALPHAQQVTHYANCDNSTTAPILNIDDFTCFINQYAAGCP